MHTDPTTCRIVEKWNLAKYRSQGLPDIIYYADRAHEEVHRKSCLRTGNPARYSADMSFVNILRKEEIRAYNEKVRVLRKWLKENGEGLERWVGAHCTRR